MSSESFHEGRKPDIKWDEQYVTREHRRFVESGLFDMLEPINVEELQRNELVMSKFNDIVWSVCGVSDDNDYITVKYIDKNGTSVLRPYRKEDIRPWVEYKMSSRK